MTVKKATYSYDEKPIYAIIRICALLFCLLLVAILPIDKVRRQIVLGLRVLDTRQIYVPRRLLKLNDSQEALIQKI